MQKKFKMFRRSNGIYYSEELPSHRQITLGTKDKIEAKALIASKNQAENQPALNMAMARIYLSAKSPEFLTHTWGELVQRMADGYSGPTAVRWKKFQISPPLQIIMNLPIYLTEASHFLAVLDHKKAGTSTNVWLRILHNRALDMGWLLSPLLAKRAWPKIQRRPRRGITAAEHEIILQAERMPDYALFFQLLWETGGSQSDIANLKAEDIDWVNRRLYYSRRKLANREGGQTILVIGSHLESILKELPAVGPLFPRLQLLSEDERASHFRKLCLRIKVSGVTLHSYRYSWAERAYAAGMPEREAQAHLGHGSKAVHRAYAKRAEVVSFSLEHYETLKAEKLQILATQENEPRSK
jgi:integrase